MVWRDDGGCLVCGSQNAHGLHLQFTKTEDGAVADGVVPSHLQGFLGRSHGGIIAAVLDEAMYYAVAMRGMPGVATAEISVRYRKPLPTEEPFRVESRCERVTRRFAKASAVILVAGEVVAEAEGMFLPVPADIGFKGE